MKKLTGGTDGESLGCVDGMGCVINLSSVNMYVVTEVAAMKIHKPS